METVQLIVLIGCLCSLVLINSEEVLEVQDASILQTDKKEERPNSHDSKEAKSPPDVLSDSMVVSMDMPRDDLQLKELQDSELMNVNPSSSRRRSSSSLDLINSDSKRQGFSAMRGRRVSDGNELEEIQAGFSAMRGRRDQGFSAMRGRRDQGFSAMRGRRDQGFSAMRGRRDQGFSAMRGRRDQGFSAMRGRRDQGFSAMRGRRDQGFSAMRGRRDQGFSAMRGRRTYGEIDIEESGIQAGFSAMRGKRAPISSDRYIIIRGRRKASSVEHSEPEGMKRAALSPSSGSFSAMRGKKDVKLTA